MVENILKLITVTNLELCIVCYEETNNRVSCCDAAICKICYLKWLEQKRQCMHCKEDQCNFETWMDKYRVEPDFDPQEYLHTLLAHDENELLLNNIPELNINNIITLITTQLESQSGILNIIEPTDLPGPDEDFALEFGFTLSPIDANGNQIGEGVTLTQNIEHPGSGNPILYNQIQTLMDNYLNLFNQQNLNSPPDNTELFEDLFNTMNINRSLNNSENDT